MDSLALERGLRKRLAWALYMEDQWCSLVHGRPSLISKAHWAVRDLIEEDFEALDRYEEEKDALEDLKRGRVFLSDGRFDRNFVEYFGDPLHAESYARI